MPTLTGPAHGKNAWVFQFFHNVRQLMNTTAASCDLHEIDS
jgi:hypothetical protein